jgi:hypothetical protein
MHRRRRICPRADTTSPEIHIAELSRVEGVGCHVPFVSLGAILSTVVLTVAGVVSRSIRDGPLAKSFEERYSGYPSVGLVRVFEIPWSVRQKATRSREKQIRQQRRLVRDTVQKLQYQLDLHRDKI